MLARVLIPFADRVTGAMRHEGDVIDLTDDRAREIAAAGGYIELLAPLPAAEPVEKPTKRKSVKTRDTRRNPK